MKNESFKYPFSTFADGIFDGNKDGKLDTFESMFRDMHLDEMKRNFESDGSTPKNYSSVPNLNYGRKGNPPFRYIFGRKVRSATICAISLVIMAFCALIIIENKVLASIVFISLLAFAIYMDDNDKKEISEAQNRQKQKSENKPSKSERQNIRNADLRSEDKKQ